MQEQSIFIEALEKEAPAERAAYLDRVCGNDLALRQRIERLLERHRQTDSFLDSPAPGLLPTVHEPAVTERPGTIIGPYKLMEQIGEGGMGLVFVAEQQRPIRRKVALKVLKPGMDTRQVVARFEAERQALALMDHPNIAKVLEAGQTSGGRPYFVMELVKGIPITEYCDQGQLTPRERLELFLHVCQAVQHAHQKGIIHRDIKPTNVLVTLHGGTPVPKIIDFGIAKALGQQLTDNTVYTGFAQLIGTPLYMSPEQAALSGLDVDTRSDIYSLGVLLYELLTGTTPFEKERLSRADFDEIRRIIREEDSPKPSTRISTLGQAATAISTQRKSDPKRLSQLFRGELDWIVMKCLEKDRNRRYDTANGLARDIQHYLNDEPVQACPPSAWYRVRKLARRNRGAVTIAAALLMFVFGGLAVSNWLISQQRDAALRSKRERTLELFNAKLAQARANRLSRRLGQRFGTLEVIEQAGQIARELNLPPESFAELRNEAIACLALPDLRVAQEWPSPPYGSYHLAFDEKLQRYARDDLHGTISLRQVADDAEICHFPSGVGETWLGFSFDGQFLAAWDSNRVKLWKLASPEPKLIWEEADSLHGAFSPDSRLFAIGHMDGSIGVLDLRSGGPLRRLTAGPRPLMLAFNPKGRQLAVASGESVQVRDLETGKTCAEFHYPPGAEPHLAWHPNGRTVAMVGGDRVVYLGDVATGKETVKLEGFKNTGIVPTFNHGGDLLATTGWEYTLRLWDPHTGQQLFQTPGVWCDCRFSPDDSLLAADVRDNKLRLWDVAVSRAYRTLARDPVLGKGVYWTCAVSPTGYFLAAGMEDGFGFWDCRSGAPLGFIRLNNPAYTVLFEASGTLLTGGSAGPFRWPVRPDPASPGLVQIGPPQRLPFPGNVWTEIACSADGRVLASAQYWGALVWHRDRPGELIRLTPHDEARHVSVSPDGRWVATGSQGRGGAKVWDAATGRLVKHLVPSQPFVRVGFSPDGKWLATSGGVCRLWSVDAWQEGPALGEGENFGFSRDGRLLALETEQGVVRLLDPDTGQEYARLEDPNQDRANWVAFSPDGTQLIVTGGSQPLHVWDLRAIRAELAQRGLDWDLPPYPEVADPKDAPPLRVTVDLGDLGAQP
jgi:serine/threonine protein kinase/WD40 repeat protein